MGFDADLYSAYSIPWRKRRIVVVVVAWFAQYILNEMDKNRRTELLSTLSITWNADAEPHRQDQRPVKPMNTEAHIEHIVVKLLSTKNSCV